MVKFLLIGEWHGTWESPQACLSILKNFKIKQLALEFSKGRQFEIDEFYQGKRTVDELSFLHPKEPHDGRASKAVRQLIVNARKMGVRLYLIDIDEPKEVGIRDRVMAENLSKINGKVAFYCGNVHASKTPVTLPWFFVILSKVQVFNKGKSPSGIPRIIVTCGSLLPPQKTIAIKIVSIAGGKHYNFGIKTIHGNMDLVRQIRSPPQIIKSLEEGFDFLYVVRKFSPSF